MTGFGIVRMVDHRAGERFFIVVQARVGQNLRRHVVIVWFDA
jgi:hypothetical protein